MTSDRILATYIIETAHPLEKAAAVMAGEQSSGTFVPVPGETDELRARHGAQVIRITELEPVDAPSLPGSKPAKNAPQPPIYRRAEVVLSFPYENVGPSLPLLMSTVAGNLFELGQFSGLRLVDMQLPQPFADAYPGPQFGVEGTRRLTGVYARPLIGTIIKPSVGLSPEQTADLVKVLIEAGLDFIKDDELIANPPYSPLVQRARAVQRVINDHAERTGKRVMYAFQHQRRNRRNAPQPRRRPGRRGKLRHGQPDCRGAERRGGAARPQPVAHPWSPQQLGRLDPSPLAGLRLPRLPEVLAAGRGGSPARQRHSQQVQRG